MSLFMPCIIKRDYNLHKNFTTGKLYLWGMVETLFQPGFTDRQKINPIPE